MENYVVGFLFDEDKEKVVLIKKNRPDWQRGLLNGVGGKREEGETDREAMSREFEEEAGINFHKNSWCKIIDLYVNNKETGDKRISFFYQTGNINRCISKTDEELVICNVKELPNNVVYNLRWIIPLAFDPYYYQYTDIDLFY